MFQNKMVTPAIPERIYALCKILEKGPMTISELKDKMEPEYIVGKSTGYFSDYKTAAEELKLIYNSDNMLSLAVDSYVIESPQAMRRYINSMLEEFKDGPFYKVTREYFNLDKDVLAGTQNVAELNTLFSQKLSISIDAPSMRGWRFWASFLGFGYLQNMFIIPNANIFLKDLIDNSNFKKNQRYSIDEFMEVIRPQCNIIIDPEISNHRLNYGVSNGLRTLHDMSVIKLEHIMDQESMWTLYPMPHAIRSTITHITIL